MHSSDFKAEITQIYGKDKQIKFEGCTNSNFWSMTTYFESPVVALFASLVDFEDQTNPSGAGNYLQYAEYLGNAVITVIEMLQPPSVKFQLWNLRKRLVLPCNRQEPRTLSHSSTSNPFYISSHSNSK